MPEYTNSNEDIIKDHNLKKKVIGNKHSNEVYNKEFSELIKSTPVIDIEKIKRYYNDLFYKQIIMITYIIDKIIKSIPLNVWKKIPKVYRVLLWIKTKL